MIQCIFLIYKTKYFRLWLCVIFPWRLLIEAVNISAMFLDYVKVFLDIDETYNTPTLSFGTTMYMRMLSKGADILKNGGARYAPEVFFLRMTDGPSAVHVVVSQYHFIQNNSPTLLIFGQKQKTVITFYSLFVHPINPPSSVRYQSLKNGKK